MNSFTQTQQWTSGQSVADYLDIFFRQRGWVIEPTTPFEERTLCKGDRHYRKPDIHWFVEYKSGLQTAATGNIFLETISVDTQYKPGWVYTCQADAIFYATLLNGMILVINPDDLRKQIDYLKARFRERPTGKNQNKGYNTHGVIVPLAFVEQHLVEQIIPIERARHRDTAAR